MTNSPIFTPERYQSLLNHIFGLRRTTRRRTLEGMKQLLTALGNPEQRYRCIQIAGTNGKGSTAAFLEAILRKAGYRTGLFTSPHLVEFRERFRVQGKEVDDAKLYPLLAKTLACSEEHDVEAVFFDQATLVAAQLFAEEDVDVAIFEAGMGARLDATSAIPVELSILTTVGLDHTEWLGSTVEEIARDKAYILRQRGPALVGVRDPKALAVVEEEALKRDNGSSLRLIGRDFPDFTYEEERRALWGDEAKMDLGLRGEFQYHNVSLAWEAARLIGGEKALEVGVAAVREASWPGRLQKVSYEGVPVWVDGAHNPEALTAVLRHFQGKRTIILFGAMKDKPLGEILPMLRKYRVILVPVQQPRAFAPPELYDLARKRGLSPDSLDRVESLEEGFSLAFGLKEELQAKEKETVEILVVGSLFLVGDVLAVDSKWLKR